VRSDLARFACYWENQVPGLYAKAPPETSFPRAMVDACVEGAGGGNVRHFVCAPDGTVRGSFRGYLKPERFLAKLAAPDAEHAGRPIADVLREIAEKVYTEGRTG